VRIDGRPGLLYVVFEHQSTAEALMAFRLLRYMVRIWDKHVAENPDARMLPVIVPVLLHHSEAGWTAATSLEGLFDVEAETLAAMGEHVPRLHFVLDDISAESDEALRGRAMSALGRLVLWCLRSSRTPEDLVQGLTAWADLLREVKRAPNGAGALAKIWRYLYMVNDRVGAAELLPQLMAAVGEDGRDEIVNAAEELIEEGREQGREQEARELLVRLLASRFGALTPAARARVNGADRAQIEQWVERLLTAPSLEALLGGA
jgi:hypothetical protein